MPLTTHERLHLDAVIKDAEGDKLKPVSEMDKLATDRNIPKEDYVKYLDKIKTDAQAIIDADEFPVGLEPSDIHDYLEK